MTRYNFQSLSPQDFEELVRDLLSAEWRVPLEAFKNGRDKGIDLRYAPADHGTTIVQCKHYAISGFNKLLSNLSKSELPKVTRLRPERYVVAVSNGLTPDNKDEIVTAMNPFVRATGDIIGAQELEGMLSRHASVEKAHFKLWLTSTAVLERVLHNAEQCHTDFAVERIRRKLSLFVQNGAYPRAKGMLDETRVVVLSGAPGIGKTTLAEMLLYAHLEKGYEPVVIQGDIAEGRKLFKPAAKQIFYYDDFLGQTFLGDRKEYLGRNEDAGIIDFVEMVQRSEHCRFILTTREHILRNALQLSEKFAQSLLFQDRCVVEMKDYSYAQKARILYNHLYFSDLLQDYKNAVLDNSFFLHIIKHEHFNPRLIEWLSSCSRLKSVPSESYKAHIIQLLETPETIWAHAYTNQISAAARHALLAIYTAGHWISTVDLEPAFIALRRHCAVKYNERAIAGEFRRALQELDGAFLSYHSDYASFLNPSVREFVASVICDDRDTAEDVLVSSARFKQVVALWKLAEAKPATALAIFLKVEDELLFNALVRLLPGPSMRWEKMRDGSQRGTYIDLGTERRIEFLIEVATERKSTRFAELASLAARQLIASWDHQVPDFAAASNLLTKIRANSWFLSQGGREVYRSLLDGMLNDLDLANVDDWVAIVDFPTNALVWTEVDHDRFSTALKEYCESGIKAELRECADLDEKTALKDSLEELAKRGFCLKDAIHQLQEWITEEQEVKDAEKEDNEDDHELPAPAHVRSSRPYEAPVSDEDVGQMFSTLRQGNSFLAS